MSRVLRRIGALRAIFEEYRRSAPYLVLMLLGLSLIIWVVLKMAEW